MSTEITTDDRSKIVQLLEDIIDKGERYMIFTRKTEQGRYFINAIKQEDEEPEIITP